jgi:hypothetical protein
MFRTKTNIIWKLLANIREETNRDIVFREIINTSETRPISLNRNILFRSILLYYTWDNTYKGCYIRQNVLNKLRFALAPYLSLGMGTNGFTEEKTMTHHINVKNQWFPSVRLRKFKPTSSDEKVPIDCQWPLSGVHSIHDEKISPAWCGWGVHALPLSLYLPSIAKLWCTLQLRGQVHYYYFSSTLFSSVASSSDNCTMMYLEKDVAFAFLNGYK